ncbi:MAG: LemA family protein [Patescibacteria group bacterium]
MILWIVLGIIVVLAVWVIVVFNALVRNRMRVKDAWSDIDVQLKRRYDLVPNLVETVKGYKEYEASVLENVTKARVAAMSLEPAGPKDRAKAEDMFTGALKTLFAVSENYPQLKASENFKQLQDQLSLIENDIQSARRYYNATVREMNIAIKVFPTSVVAGALGFDEEEFFGVEEGEREPVKVSF